ncbi:MAG TPA: tripartite tricarboxylate transporter substrate binding protein [Burkholderiales bacterium]|nr:tripartite tricarboxylate transporter substrate binding protein [Burkholderiales bacterium]
MPTSSKDAKAALTSAWRPGAEVELIVGTPPGGGQDRPARAMMQVMQISGLVEVPMKLTNLPGKGGGNAWDAVHERPRDAHVLSVSSAPMITNKVLGVSDFDHATLTPIATLYTEYLAFVVRADSPLRTSAQLLERLRADPGGLSIAIATAVGTTNHIALGQIVQHLGGDPKRLKLRVFESALHAVTDVVEGHAEAGVVSAVSAVKALEAGALRTLAVSAPARMNGIFSGAPTWAEQSVPCTIGQWRGIIGARDIGEAEVAYWEQVFGAAAAKPAWRVELEQNHWTDTWKASADTRAFLDAERVLLAGMLTELGLTK